MRHVARRPTLSRDVA
ncbi:hypothetical protein KIPB_006735, partial [Kipferlia bialata]